MIYGICVTANYGEDEIEHTRGIVMPFVRSYYFKPCVNGSAKIVLPQYHHNESVALLEAEQF